MKSFKPFFKGLLAYSLIVSSLCLSSCGEEVVPTGPNFLQFSQPILSIPENTTQGIEIVVQLERVHGSPVSFDIYFSGPAEYGVDYTTSPAVSGNKISVTIPAEERQQRIIFYPVDNYTYQGSRSAIMEIRNVDGAVDLTGDLLGEITIAEDDLQPTTIADLRKMYSGNSVDLNQPLLIEGIVTSTKSAMGTEKLMIQDESAGILLEFIDEHNLTQRNYVRIDVVSGTLTALNGEVQVQGVKTSNITVVEASTDLPDPKKLTISEFLAGDYQGQIVEFENVLFINANGYKTFGSDNGQHVITAGAGEAEFHVNPGGPLASQVIPLGTGTLTGIAGAGNISPQALEHLFTDNPVSFISKNANGLSNFGNVATNNTSSPRSFTVTGDNLQDDIRVTVGNNFEVSLNGIVYSSAVDVSKINANLGNVTVYIRFAPTSGTPGQKEAQLTISSFQAKSHFVTVRGTEQ